MSFITKICNSIFLSDGSSATHSGEMTVTSNGHTMMDAEAPKSGDTFFHNGKSYTRLGSTLMSSDGKTWNSMNELSDDDVRGIIASDNDHRLI